MRPTQLKLRSIRRIILLWALVLPCLAVQLRAQTKPDPVGPWSWTSPLPLKATIGAPSSFPAFQRKTTLMLKLDGDKLTGTIFTQLSQPRTNAVPITDAKLEGDMLSFTATRELNGQRYVQKFSGKLRGDTIKGKIQFGRDGQPQSADWVAQRVVQASQDSPRGQTPPAGVRKDGPAPPQLPRAP